MEKFAKILTIVLSGFLACSCVYDYEPEDD